MISDFLLKGIDNFWNDKVDIKNSKKPVFSRDTLKRELSTIIKAKRDISQSRYGERQQEGTASKSRLLLHQQDDRQDKFEGIIRRNPQLQKSKSSTKVGYKLNLSPSTSKNNDRSYINRYKENEVYEQPQSCAMYMPSKDHVQRQKQCRLPIKSYKYQF